MNSLSSTGKEKAPSNHTSLKEYSELDIDKLVNPIIDIVKHYSQNEFERRILFFTWIANFFKPISAVEVSEILGYDYRPVHDLFTRLVKSAYLADASKGVNYSQVGLNALSLYVPRDLILGSKLTGRLPKLVVFKARSEIDMDAFIIYFNQNNEEAWRRIISRVLIVVADLDPSYRAMLVSDYLFLFDKVQRLLQALQNQGLLSVGRKASEKEVRIQLRAGVAKYNLPAVEPLDRLI